MRSRLTQNHIEHLQDQMQQGKLTAAQANVEMVLAARVKLVTCRIPQDVRKALNEAVKAGKLAHIAKSGKKPEAYYHPDFEYLMKGDRAEHERETNNTLLAFAAVSNRQRLLES